MRKTGTRDSILRAAREAFARKGYHRTLVDDIVRGSGTSKGAVYHHFRSKEELVLALVDDFTGHLLAAVATAIDGTHGALGKVQAALAAGLDTFRRHRELARIILLEPAGVGPAYEVKRAEVHARFGALISAHLDTAVAEQAIPPVDTRVATLAWLGAVNEVIVDWLARDAPDDLEDTVGALTTLLLRSVGAAAAPDGAYPPSPRGS